MLHQIYNTTDSFDLKCESVTLIYCNTAVKGLTDIICKTPQECAAPEGECGYVSKTLSTSVLQHLCNAFNSYVQQCL